MLEHATVYSFTTIRVAAEQFREEAPYTVAILEAPGSPRFLARLVGQSPAVGARVTLVEPAAEPTPMYRLV